MNEENINTILEDIFSMADLKPVLLIYVLKTMNKDLANCIVIIFPTRKNCSIDGTISCHTGIPGT